MRIPTITHYNLWNEETVMQKWNVRYLYDLSSIFTVIPSIVAHILDIIDSFTKTYIVVYFGRSRHILK